MSSGYTTVIYGNVKFFRCTTRIVDQKPVFDPSNTDLMYMKTTVEFTGYLNGHSIAESSYQLTSDGTSIEQIENGYASLREQQIRRQLGPRQRFTMRVGDLIGDGSGGQILIDCKPAPFRTITGQNPNFVGPQQPNTTQQQFIDLSDTDLNNGPRCLNFAITQMTGNETYSISATFELCQLECDLFGNVPNNTFGILSNRWSCTDTLDYNLQTTRTYAGHLQLASANLNAQQLRWLVLPPIVQMMRRDKMEVAVSADGLHMNWSVTDVEIAYSAPYPARKWSVTHTTGGQVAYMGRNTINVELEGDSNVNKGDLIDLAMYIITAKLFGVTPPQLLAQKNKAIPDTFWQQQVVESLQFVDITGDVNKIIATATVLSTPLKEDNTLLIPRHTEWFGQPLKATDVDTGATTRDARPGYDRSFSWGGYAGDTPPYASPAATITQIFLNYLQSPCNDIHATYVRSGSQNVGDQYGNRDGFDLNAGPNPPNVPPSVPYSATIATTIDPDPIPNTLTSAAQSLAAYTYWTLENLYKTITLRVAMPIASNAPSRPANWWTIPNYVDPPNYNPTTSVAQIGPPQTVRTLRVSAERIGSDPQFPNPETFIAGFKFPPGWSSGGNPVDPQIYQYVLDMIVRPGTPTVTVSGHRIYRADAEYTFALSRNPNPTEQLAIGTDMWSIAGKLFTILDPNSGVSNLTNSSWDIPNPTTPPANYPGP